MPELPRFESRPLMPMQYRPAISPMVSAGMPMAAPGKRKIRLKHILITAKGDEPSYLAAKDALDRMGVPYDTLIAATTNLTPDMLSDGVDTCNYNSVMIAVDKLGYWDDQKQAWTSAFTTDEWTTLENFERACSARELTLYGFPGPDGGLSLSSSFSDSDSVTARMTSAGAELCPDVQPNATIPLNNVYGYKALVTDTATTTSLVESADGFTLMSRHVSPDGRESLTMTVDSNPSTIHNLVLEDCLISWVSRGLFVGKKRHNLAPQVDDLFISDAMWDPVAHGNNDESTYRIAGDDLRSIVDWQNKLIAKMSQGSTFRPFKTSLAFNGVGTVDPGDSGVLDETLLAEAQAAGDNLMWISHTWDHENMDLMSSSDAAAEITQNCDLAAQYNLNGFSCAEVVTPDISGLSSKEAVTGMLDAGVRFAVSDSSITAEIAKAQNKPRGDNPSWNVGLDNPIDDRGYAVPRDPTNCFYDVHTREEEVDEYNTIYHSYWKHDLEYPEILDVESSFILHYLLTGKLNPLMFHQPNLHREDVNGEAHSLFGDWIGAAFIKFIALKKRPIQTLTLTEIANEMKARDAFNKCGVEATYVEADSGPTVELRSTGTCVVPITGMSSTDGTVEVYGGVPTTSIPVSAGELPKVIQVPKACPLGSSACPAVPPTPGCGGE